MLHRFLLTRLMRGVTNVEEAGGEIVAFLLTRLMRGVTIAKGLFTIAAIDFYSHASCEA